MILWTSGRKVACHVAGVTLLAVALRMGFALTALREEPRYMSPDSKDYQVLAESLAGGRGFAYGGRPTYYRVPGYPAMLAVARRFMGPEADAVVVLGQAISVVIPIGAIGWLLRRVKPEQLGAPVAAAVLLAFDPASMAHSAMLLSDAWFSALSGLVVALGIASVYGGRVSFSFLAGVSSGIAALIHPSANYVWSAGVVAHFGMIDRPWRRRLTLASCLLVGHALVVTPWVFRNYQVFGDPSLAKIRDQGLALKAGIIESYALGDSSQGMWGFINGTLSDGEVMRLFRERHAAVDGPAHARLLAIVLQHPGAAGAVELASVGVLYFDPCHAVMLQALGERGTGFFSSTTPGLWGAVRSRPLPTMLTALSVLWMVAFWLSVAVGIARWARRAPLVLGFCLLYSIYYTLVFSIGALSTGGRYRLAMLPALVVLATPALGSRFRSRQAHRPQTIVGECPRWSLWNYRL